MTVKKAVIPAAGLGTRFLPASKAQPKEMLPIVDKPTIQYIVEEAIVSGIEDIIIVTGRGKRTIEDHFDKSYELEETLLKKQKMDILDEIVSISSMANIHYIRQKEPKGLGHAIQCASRFIGDEPFAVLLGDDIVRSETPCLRQLMDTYERFSSSVVGVQQVADEDVSKYGIVEPKGSPVQEGIVHVQDLVEKPDLAHAPSNYAIMGRYVLRPEIFDILDSLPPGAGNEIQLTDAIKELNQQQVVLACEFTGERYDVGDKFGFVKATVDFALQRDDLQDDVKNYIQQVLGQQLVKG
ncbi:UTP--glucose-1-phosphate uridylyltransferase GalU [Alteribacillus sp. YIM 98480]|uniref:UTP--glucose-1-phosphate uridylyltransferase GalU n=1 Tax=Alteribacillus sp. YIM 98480 TaxID=2606599 RepID=UPI00131B832C|nr:UTP--glucose-1-phosphate uridylyltransferase GalU [Alteribacillus sp. YIM 98480]